jgi:hypothetical protein
MKTSMKFEAAMLALILLASIVSGVSQRSAQQAATLASAPGTAAAR